MSSPLGHFMFIEDQAVLTVPGPATLTVWHNYYTESTISYDHPDFDVILNWVLGQAAWECRKARRELMRYLGLIITARYHTEMERYIEWAPILGSSLGDRPKKQAYREEVLAEYREVIAVCWSRLEELGYFWLENHRLWVAEPLVEYLRNNDVTFENPLSVFDMIVTSIDRIDNNDAKDTP